MTEDGNIEVISTVAPPETHRKQMVFEGDSKENIAQLLDNLRKVL